jgi:hypothetical protein
MHVDLAAAEADLLLVLAANAGERIRRRRLVEEDRDGTVGGGLWKRLSAKTCAISVALRTSTPTGAPA